MPTLSINQEFDIATTRKEYEKLKARAGRTIDSWEDSFGWIHGFLTLVTTVITAVVTRDVGSTIVAFLAYIYIPGLFVSAIVSGILYFPIVRPLARYFERRKPSTKWYARYLELDEFILEYDREQAEQKRIRLLPVRRAIEKLRIEVSLVSQIVGPLQNFFHRKRRWYSYYSSDQEKVLEAIEKLSDIEGAANLVRARFVAVAEEVSYEFLLLFRSISVLQSRCQDLLAKMKSLTNWTPPIRRTTRPTAPPTPTNNQTRQQPPRNNGVNTTTAIPRVERPTVRPPIVVPEVVIPPPPPPKRRVLNRELRAVPLEEYVGAARARMDIGDLGEIVALHYELRRVEAETRRAANGEVTRVSKEIGNLGYDIQSISQGRKVFIEVKSTTGGFWQDFFLSSNELDVMRRLGDDYWLYRVFDLSREDGSAKLSIFRGREEIDTSFKFEPTSYKFVGRNTNLENGRLVDI